MEINGQQVQEVYYYKDMGLSEATRKALDKKGFTQATPIQGGAIPYFMEERSIVPTSDALTVHNSYTGFHALTAFHTYMPTQFL